MLAWEQMHQNNETHPEAMINQLNNWANNMNDNDVIHRGELIQLFTTMTMTINSIKNTYENQMNIMRQHMEYRLEDLNIEIANLRREITRLNNSNQILQMPAPPAPEPAPAPLPAPAYTKEELCAELLESIEETKQQMDDQTYRTLTDKLMEIYTR